MSKKVSVIVCTYNAADELAECLTSLDNQDYDNMEIVVVDDASQDGTPELLQEFKSRTQKETTLITNKSNLGVAGSRNVGIQHSEGEIIAFTDSDCVVDQKWISELVTSYGQVNVAAVGGRILDSRVNSIWNLASKGLNFVARAEGDVSYIQGCNMSFNSNVLRKYFFNDEIKYGYEETLLCDYLIAAGYRIYYNPRAVVHHKHKTDLIALLKQKYMRGVSSIWYRREQKKCIMFKRHIILLISLVCIPFFVISQVFIYLSLLFFFVFLASLVRDEIIFQNDIKTIIFLLPFLVLIELSHFAGSCAGLVKFRLSKQPAK